MKKLFKLLGLFFTYVMPFVLIFFIYVYRPDTHWLVTVLLSLGVIGTIVMFFVALWVKKKIDKRMTSSRAIINDEDDGADRHISSEDLMKLRRKVFLYDAFMSLLPFIIIFFLTLYVEKAAHSVSFSVGYVALSIAIGTVLGFIGIGGKNGEKD